MALVWFHIAPTAAALLSGHIAVRDHEGTATIVQGRCDTVGTQIDTQQNQNGDQQPAAVASAALPTQVVQFAIMSASTNSVDSDKGPRGKHQLVLKDLA